MPAERPARVFLVVAGAAGMAAPAELSPAEPLHTAAAAPKARRRRRVDVDKRPGPVQHILHTLRPAAESIVAAPRGNLSPAEEISALLAMMANLDAVFDQIEAARAFRFPA